ncbi:TIR domain-containing protein [Silanimonas sp.]|jgi:TolB-like protein|uniref:TIR domain-containing protein n=1 Tax=Silanimonas sp. TaxID=1929290 RepID=UPI0022C5E652|nr:TIR domain-containing protein [Silanimonas sp.]MCZ8114651.1 TIR domain-containing protein [Silanimonas sp.]
MSTVFLSYCRSDQADAARLAAALAAAGLDVWWDHLIEGGAAFAKRIESALEGADAVVVLWSARSIESDWVLDEAARGRDLRKLVPASLDGTPSPLGFRQYQTVNLVHWREGNDEAPLQALVRAVTAMGSGAKPEPVRAVSAGLDPLAPHGQEPTNAARRRLMLGALAAVPALGGGFYAWRHFASGSAVVIDNSVAVLPFDNLSGDAAQAYFSDGLSEEVRSTLTRNLALRVMAKSSSSRFATDQRDATEIANELRVSYLLRGTVQRQDDTVRVTVSLVEGQTGFDSWSETFTKKLTDVFAVQTEIAYAVADRLSAFVGGDRDDRDGLAAVGGTSNPTALDAYLRGRSLYDLSSDEASERAALRAFDDALAADANFAAAHAARARSLTAIANQYGSPDENVRLYAEAVAAAERAIALAPELAEAHSTLGFTRFQGQLDARGAREPFEESRRLGAGEATVLTRFAQYTARCGRHDESRDALEPALVRDPLNPLIHRAAGGIAYAGGRFADAIPPLEKALAMNPKLTRAHAAIGDSRLNLGDLDGALAAYAKEPVADMRFAGLAVAHRRAGRNDEADAAMRELRTLGDRVLYQQAQGLAEARAIDEAFDALERAHALRDSGLIYARNDPFLDPLRGDARFNALLERLGFDVPVA